MQSLQWFNCHFALLLRSGDSAGHVLNKVSLDRQGVKISDSGSSLSNELPRTIPNEALFIAFETR